MALASLPHANEIEQQLKEYGSNLLHPPSAVDELLKLLEIIEQLLIAVDQAPSRSMQEALIPCMKGLIAADILRHPNMDVKVSVAFCISEITRITAPDPPYGDEQMKEVFHLTLATFENLPHASGQCYKKVVSILDTISRVKSCLMMLDLELDDLIKQMFKQFLVIIGSSHSRTVFSAMETIMTHIINESDDISLDLLAPLLESVKKEKQDVSPLSCKLGERVITNCSAKLKPHLMETVKSMGTALDDYVQMIANTCVYRLEVPRQNSVKVSEEHSLQPEPDNLCPKDSAQSLHGASKSSVSPGEVLVDCNNTITNEASLNEAEHPTKHSKALEEQGIVENQNLNPQEELKLEIVPKSVPKKRGRKPKSMKKPEEGHDHSLIVAEKEDAIVLHKRKSCDMEIVNLVLGLPAVPLKKVRGTNDLELTPGNSQKEGTSVSPNQQVSSGFRRKRGRPKKIESMMQQDVDPNSASYSRKYDLNADVKEEVQDAPDVGSGKESKDTSVLNENPWRHTKKIGHSSQTEEDEALAEGHLASEKGADGPSAPKNKLLQKSSSKDIKKNSGAINPREDHTEISHSPKLKSTKTPMSTPQRKRSGSGKNKIYVGELDERMVGKRIKVWWPLDKTFYEAVIESFNQTKKRHKVLYTDGEVENLNLYKQRWVVIEEDVSLDGERTNNQITSSSPTRVLKKRRKSKSADGNKVASSSRRGEVLKSVTAVEASNPGDRNLAESRIDHSNIDGFKSGECGKLKDDGANSVRSDKLKDYGVGSLEGEQSKDESVISEGGEKINDNCLKSGECEKIKDDGANSVECEKQKDEGVKSMDCQKLNDGGVDSGISEKSKDDGIESAGGVKFKYDSVISEGGEKLRDDGSNSGRFQKLEDDGVESIRGDGLKDDSVLSEGGEELDDDGVKSLECEKLKDDSASSGRSEKLKDDGIESRVGDKLKYDGIKSRVCENLDDNALKSEEAEKLKDGGANSGSSEKSKDDGIESAGGEKLKDDGVKSEGGEKLDGNGGESGERKELKDDGANSGRSEKLKDYGNKSAGGEKLKDKSLKSEGGEKLDDDSVKSMDTEKLNDGSNSGRFDKLNDDGVESVGGEKLSDDSANSKGGEKLKDDDGVESVEVDKLSDDNANSKVGEKLKDSWVKSGGSEKLKDDGANSEGGEKLKDDNVNSGQGEKLEDNGVKSLEGEKFKDDVVNSMDLLKEEVFINSIKSSNRKELSNSGEDQCCNSKVNLDEGKSSKSGDDLNEERLDNIKQSTPRTETASEVGFAGEVTEGGENLNDEKLGNSELTNAAS